MRQKSANKAAGSYLIVRGRARDCVDRKEHGGLRIFQGRAPS
jgi:hypothetical protein